MAKGEAVYTFDPFKETGVSVPRKNRAEAAEAAAAYVKEQILNNTGAGKTSVDGGLWKRGLTPEYKKRKSQESSAAFANLELTGEMLDSLTAEVIGGSKIRVQVGEDQMGKAEGNLLGSYGGSPDSANAREFIPHKRGQKLRGDIIEGLAEILQEYADDGEED